MNKSQLQDKALDLATEIKVILEIELDLQIKRGDLEAKLRSTKAELEKYE